MTPSSLKVGPTNQALLNVTAKFKNSYMLQEQENSKNLEESGRKTKGPTEMFNHLLLGRVKDTHIIFSFIIQASLVSAGTGPA